ncbi:MAG TPA: S-methyl-5'-thioadenosine phosphorylase [Polyangia bacterium]|nr:S-methyl-5'-thioadenosine phosphorylase [Polyangia bacterium]
MTSRSTPLTLGVLGGSGLYDMDGLHDLRETTVSTPYGAPSGPLVSGSVGEARLLFIPRHGPGHRFSPSEINYRANVFALKAAGATRVLSVSAVGSLQDGLSPGDYVLVDQFIDKTFRRASTFFGDGVVGHVAFAEPTCASLGAAVASAALEAGIADTAPDARLHQKSTEPVKRLHRGGTYVCMEGPQFSSRAESLLHRSWGADVIGMTAATEAKLCREAELCFASLALVTDYDAWHAEEAAVTAAAVVEVLRANVAGAKAIIRDLPNHAAGPTECSCATAAAHAILTAPEAIPPEARQRLKALYGRDI